MTHAKTMQKKTIQKDDGRYLIFYAFDRPIPERTEGRIPTEDSPGLVGETSGGSEAAQPGGEDADV